jgi:predicted acylesterase/phospholipase RssA/tetratricopeptide (TPR) repeat protein
VIYTFYSFKGGVGRSMALANIAECFYLKGLRVVIVDWDLEAPGLESFFFDRVPKPTGTPGSAPPLEGVALVQSRLGLIDMLTEYRRSYGVLAPALVTPVEEWAPKSFRERIVQEMASDAAQMPGYFEQLDSHLPLSTYLVPIHEPGPEGGGLWLLPAGWRYAERFEAYAEAVQSFDWEDFYTSYRGKEFFDWLRAKLLQLADVVLIDSRTGVTEMGGVCARHLADVVVAFSAPNEQNMAGVAMMVKSFKRPETIEARSHRPLETLVVPTRVDPQEVTKLKEFLGRFAETINEQKEAPKAFAEVGTSFWDLRIPYRTIYSYEERRVIGRGIQDLDPTRGLETAYRRIAAHLALLAEEGGEIRKRFADDLQEHFPALLPKVAVLNMSGGATLAVEIRHLLADARIRVWPELNVKERGQWASVLSRAIHLVIATSESPDLAPLREHVRLARQLGTRIHVVGPTRGWQAPAWLHGALIYPTPGPELFDNLRTREAATRAPSMSPSLPGVFVERSSLQQRLKSLLIEAAAMKKRSVITLWGDAGFGKSVLAAAVTRDDAVADVFPDGVLWVSASDKNAPSAFYSALTGTAPSTGGSWEAIGALLRGRKALLVIDDVWSVPDLSPFRELGDRATHLVLTRNLDVAATVAQQVVTVGEMTADEAAQLLTGSASQGLELAAALDRWPLAVALARVAFDQELAKQKSVAEALDELTQKLRRHNITAFDLGLNRSKEDTLTGTRDDFAEKKLADKDVSITGSSDEMVATDARNQSVAASIDATRRYLASWQRRRLEQLAATAKGDLVNFDAVSRAWDKSVPEQSEPRPFAVRERERLCQIFNAFSLIEWNARDGSIRLRTPYRRVLEAEGVIGSTPRILPKRRVSSAADRETNSDVVQVKRILGGQDVGYAEALDLYKRLKVARYFGYARQLLVRIRRMPAATDKRLWLAQQLALCTYKDPDLPTDRRSSQALEILNEADPLETTRDQETLGLAGAVYKYRFKALGQVSDLERSAGYYLRGYDLGIVNDYGYTSINAAFVLDLLAQHEEREAKKAGATSDVADERRRKAAYIREGIAELLPPLANVPKSEWLRQQWWYLVTIAEALFGLGRHDQARFWLREAMAVDVVEWEFESTARQLAELAAAQNDNRAPEPGSPASLTLQLFLANDAAAVESVMTGKVGLALSGGGFRASLFHIGVLARLAELDLLRRVEIISCVSGGSILGAHYYLEVRKLMEAKSDEEITSQDYIDLVRRLERDFLAGVQRNLRTRLYANPWVSLKCLVLPRYNRTDRLGELFESQIFSRAVAHPTWLLKDLTVWPKGAPDDFSPKLDNWRRTNKVPVLVLNATTLNTGHNWQFTATWMGEPPPGQGAEVDSNDVLRRMYYWEAPGRHKAQRLGRAVAASACVPGLFDPVVMDKLFPSRQVRLVDGGVHDNQGVSALVEQECAVMLVSDASGQMESQRNPGGARFHALRRSATISQARVREMEFRDLESRFRSSQIKGLMFLHLKKGLDGDPIDWVGCLDPFDVSADAKPVESRGPLTPYGVPKDIQARLAGIRTDLDSFSDVEADALMYSGYRMASSRIGDCLPGVTLPPASPQGEWRFLSITRAATKAQDFDEAHEDVGKLLAAGRSNAGKIWRVGGLHWLLPVLAALAIAANVNWREWGVPLLFVGELVFVIPWVLMLAALVATLIWIVCLLFSLLGWRRPWLKVFTATLMSTVGWIPWALHQHVVDPLFLRRGARASEGNIPTLRRLWKPLMTGGLLLALIIVPFVKSALARGDARERADATLARGRWEEAVIALDEVIEANPNDPSARISRAWAKRELGRYFEAYADLDSADELLNCSDVLNRARGATSGSSGDAASDALIVCRRSARDRAYTYLADRQWDKAITSLNQTLRSGSDDPRLFMLHAWADRERGELEQAIVYYTRANEGLNCAQFLDRPAADRRTSAETVTLCRDLFRERAGLYRMLGLSTAAAGDERLLARIAPSF